MIFHRKNVEIGKKFTQCKQNQSIIVSTSLTSRYVHAFQTGPMYIHVFDVTFAKFWHSECEVMLLYSNDYVAISRLDANGRSLRRNTTMSLLR